MAVFVLFNFNSYRNPSYRLVAIVARIVAHMEEVLALMEVRMDEVLTGEALEVDRVDTEARTTKATVAAIAVVLTQMMPTPTPFLKETLLRLLMDLLSQFLILLARIRESTFLSTTKFLFQLQPMLEITRHLHSKVSTVSDYKQPSETILLRQNTKPQHLFKSTLFLL